MEWVAQGLSPIRPTSQDMDTLVDEAMILGDRQARDLALEIRNHENAHQAERQRRIWNLGDMIQNIRRPYLRLSDIVTVVEAAPDEEAQLQTVMARLAKRGEWDPLVAELAIMTVGPQDKDALVDFLESLAIKDIEHSKTAQGKSLIKCVACEEELQPKDLILTTCGHCYCGSCLITAFQTAVSDESLYPPSCCANTPIPLDHATRFLDPELETTFEEKGVEFSTVDRTYCSDPTCSTFIPPDDYYADRAICPKCLSRTCVVCKAPGHEGDCPADLELAALLKYAEEMRWQRCYSCFSVVQRRDGCSHMECRCGANFCYTCGRQIYLDETSRCPCQNIRPPPYSFYRRPVNRRPPPDSPATTPRDDLTLPQTDDWTLELPSPGPIWVGVPDEISAEQEQDRLRAGTPDMPEFEVPPPENLVEDVIDDERNSLTDASRRSIDQPSDIDIDGAVTPRDADATSHDALLDMLRQLLTVFSTHPVFLHQERVDDAPISTVPAIIRDDSASDHVSVRSDHSSQHTRSQASRQDTPRRESVSDDQISDYPNSQGELAQSNHNGEDGSGYQASKHSSSISIEPTRHRRLRTKLSPRRLLRVLRNAGMSALRRRGHTSPHGDRTTFE